MLATNDSGGFRRNAILFGALAAVALVVLIAFLFIAQRFDELGDNTDFPRYVDVFTTEKIVHVPPPPAAQPPLGMSGNGLESAGGTLTGGGAAGGTSTDATRLAAVRSRCARACRRRSNC